MYLGSVELVLCVVGIGYAVTGRGCEGVLGFLRIIAFVIYLYI